MKSLMTHRLMRPLAAAFVGASTTLSFAPYDIWPMAFVSPLLLLLLLNGQTCRSAAVIGYAWGLGLFATGISWVHVSIDTFGGMPKIASILLMTLLVGYLAIYTALFAALFSRLKAHNSWFGALLVTPALWLISEWLRGWVFTGFPWLLLGYTQIDSPLAGLAPIAGVDFISMLVVSIASAIAFIILRQQWKQLWIPVALFCVSGLTHYLTWVTPDNSRKQTVALIQGNVQQETKWLPSHRWPTLMMYMDHTRENWDADIIIWPEAAIPAFEGEVNSFMINLDKAARQNNSAVITGVLTQQNHTTYYNSVTSVGVTPSGEYHYETQPRYYKHHLLPFGEFVPFEDLLRPLAPFFNLPMSSFNRGDYIQDNVVANGMHMVVALCYEIIFGQQLRDNVTDDTDYILTLSNDAWFGHSNGPLQHMAIARMRALEFGMPVIRATNNGVTAVTDYQGKITAELPQFKEDVLKTTVVPTNGKTPYVQFGGLPLKILVAVIMMIVILLSLRDRRKNKDSESIV
ncbi:apolipoprotein N-acyltransferase [Vibrio sp. UCD-FRSSP16_10]|uniref:apolipoprotein N-acyltransferase n=1 Tax=unclassified Vibrio TaxID=2614977 RepID=UPI0008017064|nr:MULTISPECIES: apolipoprotein N-acyltransferase [unclassified Vibrio]OBT12879.1 apolipoprotein N-acyltransferase [Vibrio sp. UCD-FRSSP16_30]OBT18215.1 apolipoprotein N-acyltransferase [Vibrio sp. UCD-FRSSP16_10]